MDGRAVEKRFNSRKIGWQSGCWGKVQNVAGLMLEKGANIGQFLPQKHSEFVAARGI